MPERAKVSESIFHLRPRVADGRKIEILGITHGGLTEIPRPDQKYLRKVLSRRSGLIFTEDQPKSFVPKEFIPRTRVLELPIIHSLGERAFRKLARQEPGFISRLVAQDFFSPIFDFKRHFLKATVHTKPAPKRQIERELFDNTASREMQATPEWKFISNVRSLFMAGEALRRARTAGKPVVIVTGVGHASQIHEFIENPRLSLRYLNRLAGPVGREAERLGGRKSSKKASASARLFAKAVAETKREFQGLLGGNSAA
jgi:hypothetical protein